MQRSVSGDTNRSGFVDFNRTGMSPESLHTNPSMRESPPIASVLLVHDEFRQTSTGPSRARSRSTRRNLDTLKPALHSFTSHILTFASIAIDIKMRLEWGTLIPTTVLSTALKVHHWRLCGDLFRIVTISRTRRSYRSQAPLRRWLFQDKASTGLE